jgi:uncharacterized protein YbaR (Trm112 family)
MIKPDLLAILRCPDTHQHLSVADAALVAKLNDLAQAGKLKNKAGQAVSEKFEEGLLRQDRQILYPIRNNIPLMLVDEGIPLTGLI